MKQISFTIISVLVAMVAAFFSFTINAKTTKGNGPQVIMTGEIAKKVIGYNGTTPVSISINNGYHYCKKCRESSENVSFCHDFLFLLLDYSFINFPLSNSFSSLYTR